MALENWTLVDTSVSAVYDCILKYIPVFPT